MKIEVIEHPEKGKIIRTLEDVEYLLDGIPYTVPAGFESDGFSVPQFLWGFISPCIDWRTLHGAVFHDFLYKCRGRFEEGAYSRYDADTWLAVDLLEHGMPMPKVFLIWVFVRLFGWLYW